MKLNKAEDYKEYSLDANLLNKALISSIGEGIIITNEYGIITEINERALIMLGLNEKQTLGTWLPETIPAKDLKGNPIHTSERSVSRAILLGEPISDTISYTRSDGSIIPVFTTAAPLIMKNKPIGAVIVFRDYSRELLVDKAKDEFVSFASHQLRTPLTAIKLYSQILRDPATGELNDEQAEYITRIETATKKMLLLVSDFLNISKLELGELKIHLKPTDVGSLTEKYVNDLTLLATERSITINYKKPTKKCIANTDPHLISEVMHNLITNAIRYSSDKKGVIDISINRKKDFLILSISDNGIGIPEEVKSRIFERHYRAPNAVEFQPDGNGLGLYFAKRVAETCGGDLWFDSNASKGTTFNLSLPIK